MLDHFDIVGFDPRGTGDSTAVDCLTDEQLDDYLASEPVPDSPAELAEFENRARTFGEGCVTNSGALAAHVSTVEAVRDMDILRAVLGEPRLDFFGASYGTMLGATYAQIFPKRIGRMVLDGASTCRSIGATGTSSRPRVSRPRFARTSATASIPATASSATAWTPGSPGSSSSSPTWMPPRCRRRMIAS